MTQAVDHQATPIQTTKSAPRMEPMDNQAFVAHWPAAEMAVLRTLRRRIRDPELVKDLAQTTALQAIKALHTNRMHIQNFTSFCVTIATHLAIDTYRKSARNALRASCQIEDQNEPMMPPIAEDQSEQLREMLREIVPQLPERQAAVAHGVIAGMTVNEIGEKLGRTPRRIQQLVDDITQRVKMFFGSEWL